MLFIGGTGRSGTTVLAQSFIEHPDFVGFIEPRFLTGRGCLIDYVFRRTCLRGSFVASIRDNYPRLVRNLERFGGIEDPRTIYNGKAFGELLATVQPLPHSRGSFARAIIEGITEAGKEASGASVAVWKEPHLILYADRLVRLFQFSKVIHVIRDPRDICASLIGRQWGPQGAEAFVGWYNELMSKARLSYLKTGPHNYATVSFDRMIDAPAKTIQRLFQWADYPELDAESLDKMAGILSAEKAHRSRFSRDLSEIEANMIHRECWPQYQQWLNIAIT